MSIIAHVADTHIASTGRLGRDPATGLDRDMLERANALHWCATDARYHMADCLVIAGDLFHTPKPTPTEWQLTFEALNEWTLGAAQLPVHILVGNHDLAKQPAEISAPRMMAAKCVHVHELPGIGAQDGFDLATFPYPNKQVLLSKRPDLGALQAEQAMSIAVMDVLRNLAAQRRPGVPLILAAHLPLGLARLSSEREMDPFGMDWSVNPFDLEGLFDLALLGHYHIPQWPTETVCYAGSPMEFTFGDEQTDPEAQGRGYYLHDTETGQSTFRVYHGAPQHLTLDLRNGDEWSADTEIAEKIVRVQLAPDDTRDPLDFQKTMMGIGALSCRVERQARPVERRERAVEAGLSAEEYLRQYVAERHPDEDVEGVVTEARRIEEAAA